VSSGAGDRSSRECDLFECSRSSSSSSRRRRRRRRVGIDPDRTYTIPGDLNYLLLTLTPVTLTLQAMCYTGR